MSYQTQVHSDGPNKQVVESGGEIEVLSGGTLDVQSGSTVTLAGTNALSGTNNLTGTSNLSGATVRTVTAKTATYTVLASQSGQGFTNEGAAGAIEFDLPAATVGLEYFFQVQEAQALRIDPNGSETISLPSTGVAGAAGKYLEADAVGETVHLFCFKAGTWGVVGYTGTWSAEA